MNNITFEKPKRPIKVIQFGGGVFLRGFFDWMLQKANDSGKYCGNAVIVRSKTGGKDPLEKQNYNYTHVARDANNSDITLIDSVYGSVNAQENYEGFLALGEISEAEVIVSNTTEAGIVYEKCDFPNTCPSSFPAKLAALLYTRYKKGLGGMLILPLELIEDNGDKLKEAVLRHASDWKLGEGFCSYINEKCSFRNTLVDRIVSGAPNDKVELGYLDENINASESFHLFVIEGEPDARLPFDKLGLNVRYVTSATPYRTIKVRILNGAHISMIPYALLRGVETVKACLEDEILSKYLKDCLGEIVESLDIDRKEAEEYAKSVVERFSNPFILHKCSAISLNAISKFKVRIVPSIVRYEEKYAKAPEHLVFSLAMLIKFYKQGSPNDDIKATDKLKNLPIEELLSDTELWGTDLSKYTQDVERYLNTF